MKKNIKYNCKPFYYCLIVLVCVFGVFYAKFVYYSDTPLHTLVAQTILFQDVECDLNGLPLHAYAYPLYHLAQKMTHLLLQVDYNTAAALLLPITISISACMYRKLILMIVEDTDPNRYLADIFSLGAVLFNTARCWLNDWRFYRAQCGANPFHNPTLLFVRPLAIASFIYFVKWVRAYGSKGQYKWAALFGVFTFLSVAAKPSYAIVFLPAMGIYTIYHMLRNRGIKFGIVAFIAVLPSLVLLVIQQTWVSSQTAALDIIVEFGGFSQLAAPAVIMSSLVSFPVVILLFQGHWLKKDSAFFISILALLIGWFQMYLLNTGRSGDFSWGYDLAIQFATVVTLAETRNGEKVKPVRRILHLIAYAVFAYQIGVGIQYLQKIYTTTQFWF